MGKGSDGEAQKETGRMESESGWHIDYGTDAVLEAVLMTAALKGWALNSVTVAEPK